jgi:hypothetical protein
LEKFLLVHIPGLLLALLFLAVAVGASLGGLLLVHRSVALSTLERHNDVAGFIIAVVGVLYAVLLAFVVVVTWQSFDRAGQVASEEAQFVEGLYRDASVFGPQAGEIRRNLDAYATFVATREWSAMGNHQHEDLRTDDALDGVWQAYRSLTPDGPTQQTFYADSIRRLNDLQKARADRLEASASQLPDALWGVLLAGAVITVGFTYFFGLANVRAQALMVTALAAMIGLTLFLIFSLDLPFSGDLAVQPNSMKHTVAELHRFDASLKPGG